MLPFHVRSCEIAYYDIHISSLIEVPCPSLIFKIRESGNRLAHELFIEAGSRPWRISCKIPRRLGDSINSHVYRALWYHVLMTSKYASSASEISCLSVISLFSPVISRVRLGEYVIDRKKERIRPLSAKGMDNHSMCCGKDSILELQVLPLRGPSLC